MSKRVTRILADDYRTKPLSTTTVRVIARHAGTVLVEWRDVELGVQRRSQLPERDVTISADGRTAEARNPDEGLPYGDPLEDIIGYFDITAETIAVELRRQGLWTVKDLETRPGDVAAALSTVIGLDVSSLIDRARLWKRGQAKR